MAIAMLRRMRELRSEWQELGAEHPFQLRIGINTGYCTVGNFGSTDRMDYTIIGNMVNMTARLQSHAEVDGILMGHETYSLVKDVVTTEERSSIKVKGFAEAIRCYKVLGLYDDLVREGQVIREEQAGFKFMLDLQKRQATGHHDARDNPCAFAGLRRKALVRWRRLSTRPRRNDDARHSISASFTRAVAQ